MGKIKQLLGINLAVFLIFALLKPERFLTAYNFESMCFQFPEAGLLTLGIGITMLTAGADLSIVAVANLTATVNGIILLQYMPAGLTGSGVWSWLLLCLAFAAVIGLVCGVINGLLVAKLGIFPILATLGTQNLFTGICNAGICLCRNLTARRKRKCIQYSAVGRSAANAGFRIQPASNQQLCPFLHLWNTPDYRYPAGLPGC